jgi:hypothetical protein
MTAGTAVLSFSLSLSLHTHTHTHTHVLSLSLSPSLFMYARSETHYSGKGSMTAGIAQRARSLSLC